MPRKTSRKMSRRTSRQKKIRGGAIIGEGGQGCIYSPAWTSATPDDDVLKFSRARSAKQEHMIASKLASLDPTETFGIYVKGPLNCNVPTSKMVEQGLKDYPGDTCQEIAQQNNYPGAVCAITITKYLGDLEKIPEAHFTTIFKGFQHLWKCLMFLQENDYVHSDIKAGNIAFTKSGTFVLADWGWATSLTNCDDVVLQIEKMLPNEYYASDPYGTGPWCPLLFDLWKKKSLPRECEKLRQLLFFNDVFGLSKFQVNAMLTIDSMGFLSDRYEKLNNLFEEVNTTKYYLTSKTFIKDFIKAYQELIDLDLKDMYVP